MIELQLQSTVAEILKTVFGAEVEIDKIEFQKTNAEYKGDITLVVFPFLKFTKLSPPDTAKKIGELLLEKNPNVKSFEVVKGFLNLTIDDTYWINYFNSIKENSFFYITERKSSDAVMVEFASPNTNKPLHLGHIRNILLGDSVARILDVAGNKVLKVNLINDRGIHICKSMLAWMKWGNNETPESSGIKGDKLVGKYYVEFDKHYKKELKELTAKGVAEEEAEKKSQLMSEAQALLRKWEAGDNDTVALWKKMNGWVYAGFDETYEKLNIAFDKIYYESNTYLLGKVAIEEGLNKKVFFKKEDGSVWIDLTAHKLDEKLLLRSDGTSVYMTQDIGTAIERHKEYPEVSKMIYTVGNEQDYHFKVLFLILEKLGYAWARNCYHLSYGMVELPEGKMKSREGTVVDADDLIDEMISTARSTTQELGKIESFNEKGAEALYSTIAMGALKYFILKVDPKKKMLFNPKESIDFNGNTGPFIQYTHARIRSVIKKSGLQPNQFLAFKDLNSLNEKEKALIKLLHDMRSTLSLAASGYSPAVVANYVYELAKEYNQFYHDYSILKEENENIKLFRLSLSEKVAQAIRISMQLLGIEVPERM